MTNRLPEMGVSLLAGGAAFFITVLLGPSLIAALKHYKIGKIIRIDGPQSHMTKMGTPTMGGILFVGGTSILIGLMYLYTRVAARVTEDFAGVVLVGTSLAVPVFVMIAFAIFGGIDDYMGVQGVRRGEGMRGRTKALIQTFIATVAALVMYFGLGISKVGIPGVAEPLDLGVLWIGFAIFIIHATANSVNLTDGLDGLAAMISLICYAAYGVISYLQGQSFLSMLCFVMVGSLLGFLWFNVHPARMFMGGVGSEALGATLGVIALMSNQWLLLPIIAIVPVSEALSVMIQVSYFKRTKRLTGEGKRFFKMSPLHNHFVQLGWSEPQIVMRFWLIGIIAAMVGVGLALFGNNP
jgi:phospho-N-acetylmuramoyl-pentapeptide-transferase